MNATKTIKGSWIDRCQFMGGTGTTHEELADGSQRAIASCVRGNPLPQFPTATTGHRPMKRQILLSLMTILLAGCQKDRFDDHLRPGTEMMLTSIGEYSVTVENMFREHYHSRVPMGTKVRVIKDCRNLDTYRETDAFMQRYRDIDIHVLEGQSQNENYTVKRYALDLIERTP